VQYVHRISFEEHAGRKPVGIVRHTCDNRACYNPDHLIEGTKKQNSEDMVLRDRHVRGENHHASKLKSSQVLAIREALEGGARKVDLAREYEVSETTIRQIGKRDRWSDPRNFGDKASEEGLPY
jgi:hypothetical protein